MADEAVLRIKVEEVPGTSRPEGAKTTPTQQAVPGQQPSAEPRRRSAGSTEQDHFFDLLVTVLGPAGLGGAIVALARSIANFAGIKTLPAHGTAATFYDGSGGPSPRRQGQNGPSFSTAGRRAGGGIYSQSPVSVRNLLMRSEKTGIISQTTMVRSAQTTIDAPNAVINVRGGRGAPPGPAPRGPTSRPPRRPRGPAQPPRYPAPVPRPATTGPPALRPRAVVPREVRYPAPGQEGEPAFFTERQPRRFPPPAEKPMTVLPAEAPTAAAASAIGPLLGAAAVVGAVISAVRALGQAIGNTVDKIGGVAQALTSAQINITQSVGQIGASLASTGETFTQFGNLFGIPLIAAGKAVQNFSAVLDNLTAVSERYAEVNPTLAIAQARVEIQALFNDMRRGRELAGPLSQFVQARGNVEQRYEDLKAQFIKMVTPMATNALEILSYLLEGLNKGLVSVEGLAERQANPGTTQSFFEGMAVAPTLLRALLQEAKESNRRRESEELTNDPTSIITSNMNPFDVFSGLPTPPPRGQ